MFFLLFKLQRLVSENLHFERWNPTFCRALVKKKFGAVGTRDGKILARTAGVHRIGQSNQIEASSQSHGKSQIVTISKRLASIERNNAITITKPPPPPPPKSTVQENIKRLRLPKL